ncbi:DUF389 domain-containing protein [Stackebrandtia nassauensis]|uniref:Integral membrane protein n=1 Tax=Stackebrandtia nassauensis (strain DSM 44728 / CIP 108903 / NRRL B-16338 / NBRC 102104 / LLR-40K-21) TaxID=446470 RepID=D3PYE2_STANL|nr:DUF389 domain-containing protein [Stackebrandtia nassauensis]ADD41509.1 conserved hypothetical protein [Stackebrandtia nassauensis DSM 44728]
MQHLRIISPVDRTDAVCEALSGHCGVTNLVVFPNSARKPAGDLVQCDVARESVNEVLDELDALGIDDDGSIAMERVDLSISLAADNAKDAAPGDGEDAVVWDELAQKVDESSRLTWSFVAFLAIATQIAAIGVLLDSPIMIVGAMVLGPEFGPVAAIGFGMLRREWWRIGVSVRTLVFGFAAAIAVTWLCAFVSVHLGWIEPVMLDTGSETKFIVKPDKWSFIVAVLAGIAGVLSLTSDKSSALVGVFISVTTVPAAGYIAVAIALAHWAEVTPSIIQLGLNLGGMIVSGLATLIVLRLLWGRAGLRERIGT